MNCSRSLWVGLHNDLIATRDCGQTGNVSGSCSICTGYICAAHLHSKPSHQFCPYKWDITSHSRRYSRPWCYSTWPIYHRPASSAPHPHPRRHWSYSVFRFTTSAGRTVRVQAFRLLLSQWNVPALPGLLWVRLNFMVLRWATLMSHAKFISSVADSLEA